MEIDKAAHYNAQYRKRNYFGYKEWLLDRYISSLIDACRLKPGATVLDVGCGQGFFSYLFRKHGMNVCGIDISEVGIGVAANMYGHLGINFAVGDIETVVFPEQFDCVFVRSCSLYNRADFSENDEVTQKLLRYVRPSGVLMFLYNSNVSSKRSDSWRFHSWNDTKKHFSGYVNARLFFSIKIDTCFLGRYAFAAFVTKINLMLSKITGVGGDLVCLIRNPTPRP